ncbi:MAG: PDZ domain-containing protein, partial [Gammaproteobacteria bacterium]|nr:PDZ domain-containing protein [Gammaproteobacteria bacterium]
GQDVRTDIALLKVAAKNLPTVKFGSTKDLKVGQWVLAIGSPFGFDHSATQGIISALSRSLPDGNYVPFIQTDVAVNPGNSGGPLFNTDGEVIGVNSQIYTRSGGFMGLSFAIPIDVVKNVTDQLKEKGRVTRGWLGVYIQDMDQALAESFGLKRPRGALVSQVSSNSPAEKADLQAGDVILQFNNKKIIRSGDLPPAVGAVPAGETATLSILRDGKNLEVKVQIGELPDDRTPKPKAKAKDENSRLGVTATDLTDEQRKELDISGGRGVVVTQVEPGSAADEAGIEIGDVILTFNKENVKNVKQLQKQIQGVPVDKPIQVLINREGQARFLVVKLKGQ